MSDNASLRGRGIALPCALLLLLAAVDGLAAARLGSGRFGEPLTAAFAAASGGDLAGALRSAWASGALLWLAVPVAGPLLVALVLLAGARRRGGARPSEDQPPTAVAGPTAKPSSPQQPPPDAVGLRLLAVLQEEARLVDFVREDIESYSDEQVGSAVRGIHGALRKALDQRLTVEPILPGDDGDAVQVPAGFDPGLIRITGSPSGVPPYRGTLRHGGWRARDVRLPRPTEGGDPTVLMPAEVEVG